MPNLDQHRCNRTVSSRSGAAPLAAAGLLKCHFVRKIPDVEQHRCYGTGYGSIDTHRLHCSESKNSASLVGEKSYVGLGHQISEMARLMRTEKKKLLVKIPEMRLRPET